MNCGEFFLLMLPWCFNSLGWSSTHTGDECLCILIHFRMSPQKLDDRYRRLFMLSIGTSRLYEDADELQTLVRREI